MSTPKYTPADYQVITLFNDGCSPEDIGRSLGYDPLAVKAILLGYAENASFSLEVDILHLKNNIASLEERLRYYQSKPVIRDKRVKTKEYYLTLDRISNVEGKIYALKKRIENMDKRKQLAITEEEQNAIYNALKQVALYEENNVGAKVKAGIYLIEEATGRNDKRVARRDLSGAVNITLINKQILLAKEKAAAILSESTPLESRDLPTIAEKERERLEGKEKGKEGKAVIDVESIPLPQESGSPTTPHLLPAILLIFGLFCSSTFAQSIVNPYPWQYQDTTPYVSLDSRTQLSSGLKFFSNITILGGLTLSNGSSFKLPPSYVWTNSILSLSPSNALWGVTISNLIATNATVGNLSVSTGATIPFLTNVYFTNSAGIDSGGISLNTLLGLAMLVSNVNMSSTHAVGVPGKALSLGITNFYSASEVTLSNAWFFGIPSRDILAGTKGPVVFSGIVDARIYSGLSITNGFPVGVWCYGSDCGIGWISNHLKIAEMQIGIALEDGQSTGLGSTNRVRIIIRK